MRIETARTVSRPWRETDRGALAAMLADPRVMWDYGGPLSRAESDAKLDRYARAYARHGYSRWALEGKAGGFLGYVGLMPVDPDHPMAGSVEIGWRLVRGAWGHGYATEAARASLRDGFARLGFPEVVSYTAADNARSQAVMGRLGLERDAARDFVAGYGDNAWAGLVWVARPDMVR
jgi:RimJ/RimL family protein N-acetyltransferase